MGFVLWDPLIWFVLGFLFHRFNVKMYRDSFIVTEKG